MASNPQQQRIVNRRSHVQPPGPNQAPMHSVQPREASRSPSFHERPRNNKAQSMPMVPSAAQIFAANGNNVPAQLVQQQSSPTLPSAGLNPPARMLPIPPDQQSHPNGQPGTHDIIPDRRPSSSPGPQYQISQNTVNTHYPRPIPRQQPAFLSKFTGADSDQHMTEVLADIERATDQQQFSGSYPSPYLQNSRRSETPSPPKDPNVERLRVSDRASPISSDSRRQREQARDSPKARDRQPNSPGLPNSFAQQQTGVLTPERGLSPTHHTSNIGIDQQHSAPNYSSRDYTRDSPNAPRRTIGTDPRNSTSTLTLATQSPPLLANPARTPDRSLPFQEEAEDEFTTKNHWQTNDSTRHASSPTPSSDLNPEGTSQRYDHNGRNSQNGRRVDDNSSQHDVKNDSGGPYSEEDSGGGSYTPRSPTAPLPPTAEPRTSKEYYQPQAQRLSPKATIRVKTRNGSTDGLGLRSLTPSAFESPSSTLVGSNVGSHISTYSDHRQIQETQNRNAGSSPPHHQQQHVYPLHPPQQVPQQSHPSQQHQPQQYQQLQHLQAPPPHPQIQHQHQQQQPQHYNPEGPSQNQNGYYAQSQGYPDEFHNYSEDPTSLAYLHAYLTSPRPDAPIPPTPHSQTAAPSPSPFNAYGNGRPPMPYSPIAPVGSPFPYPFTHVARNRMTGPAPSQYSSNHDQNHPANVQEQLAKQWQIYLQNQARGNMTDTTYSPAATPFQGSSYNPFSFLHIPRLTRQARDTMSMRSSPSHEPVNLPPAPMLNKKREKNLGNQLRRQLTARKPPPRVESTVPRDTSPEPSSSGEETAGEEKYSAQNSEIGGGTSNGTGLGIHKAASKVWTSANQGGEDSEVSIEVDDGMDDWIDEDEDNDNEDLLDFEYHPNYISNTDRRRRRWEVGWDALVQAFQNLDRQTDTTMVVLAAPAHTSKLHSIRSRSIRRLPTLSKSTSLREIRSNFKRLANNRKNLRPLKPVSIVEKLLESQSTSGDGSDGSSESRAEDLRRALETACGSLNLLNGMYEMRETRWQEEMKRMQEDKEKMALVLQQVLGDFSSQNGLTPRQ
ncbi:hypothetical protein FA15DRAFT_619675 [Coprinopsis marcescibilis]|uniref:Uncharacterized protein n=1 Tax=Coprinopsis marcescibilis TaxID=230819 RepID=A0A5C3KWI8_COPMA|nr:hypothetical protein FA15DRAFT_619675 [Coprinopsis marcescibilis]